MKKIFVILILGFISSCDNDDSETVIQEDIDPNAYFETIVGDWQLVSSSFSDGGPEQIIREITNGRKITFLADNSFTSSEDCSSGVFSINTIDRLYSDDTYQELALIYDCEDFEAQFLDENGAFTYFIFFTDSNHFSLSPSHIICIEGCSSTYERK